MNVWSFLQKELSSSRRSMLLIVIDHAGSSPGKQGFKMAVSETGAACGTIGGGPMEYRLLEKARRMLCAGQMESRLFRLDHDPAAGLHWSGLRCLGKQVVAMVPVDGEAEPLVAAVIRTLERQERGMLAVEPGGMQFSSEENPVGIPSVRVAAAGDWWYREPIGFLDTLYIFGGGHVSLALSRIFYTLDFRILVFDDRPDPGLLAGNPYAHQKEIIDFRLAGERVPEGEHSFVAIMTSSQEKDVQVLEQLLDKRLPYLGMMGSRSKVRAVLEELRKAGHPEDLLEKLHAPIGLIPNSRSPAEIAVSVAAEILAIRSDPGRLPYLPKEP